MVIKAEELKKEIEKKLKKYEKNEMEISGRNYPVHIFEKDEDINLFEGLLFAEADKKAELSDLLNYRPPVSGYTARFGIIIYRNEELIIKDYRANKQIRKTIAKINDPFLKKLKKALEEPKSENISALFSRSDVIEEFYVLYKKCREFLLRNVTGIAEEERRGEFVDNFMMQMLTLWYLQEKGFFNKDRHYFVTKFRELKQKKLTGGFGSYYDFLRHFFRQISGYSDEPYAEDEEIGKCVVIGPAVFLNGEDDEAITIPDKCFYQEGVTEKLINLTPKGRRRMISEKDIDFDVPLLNLFESRDWVEGDIDEYVLGSIYEKLITYMERKKLGAFYTPEEITSYICKNTIEPYLVDRINEEFDKDYKSIDEIINAEVKEELLRLFDLLEDIKILDPAVGSAHFLESAINVLVEIYRKLRDKAEEVGIKKLEILVANEEGKIEPLNLLEIPEKEGLFEVYVKFFIILSRNIYGVDINPSALKVARARLFLTLARHFNVNAGVFIRFPNVHFNLREGNSLIGYVDVPRGKKETKQVTLNFSFEDHEIEYIQERIRVDDELKEYLPEIARSLKIKGDLVKEVEEMNRILASKKIKWGEFERVLRTKEKLIQVLVASLNSRYAVKLNKLLRDITELFNSKLDEKFAEEYGIDLKDLKKIKTFHWIFEFPEVFLEKGGFDVVIGNPPYVDYRSIDQIEREFLNLHFESTKVSEKYSYYIPFTERSIQLNRYKGNFCFIMPQKWLSSDMGLKLRQFILESFSFYEIVDLLHTNEPVFKGQSFANVGLYFISKYKSSEDDLVVKYGIKDVRELFAVYGINTKIDEITFFDTRIIVPKASIKIVRKILRALMKNSRKLKENISLEWGTSSSYGNVITTEKDTSFLPFIQTSDIDTFVINWQGYFIPSEFYSENRINQFKLKKLVITRRSPTMRCAIDVVGFALGKVAFATESSEQSLEYLCTLLNSNLLNFAYFSLFETQHPGGSFQFDIPYLNYLPIKEPNDIDIKILKNVHDLISFSKLSFGSNEDLEFYSKFLLHFSNYLVYELYFKQKFIEDSRKAIEEGREPIYPQLENGSFLIDMVAKYLKLIDYNSYAKLAYSIEPLSEEEMQKMEKMKEEYLKTIKEVVEAIKADKEIMGLIERIKSHEWVKVIEGGV